MMIDGDGFDDEIEEERTCGNCGWGRRSNGYVYCDHLTSGLARASRPGCEFWKPAYGPEDDEPIPYRIGHRPRDTATARDRRKNGGSA